MIVVPTIWPNAIAQQICHLELSFRIRWDSGLIVAELGTYINECYACKLHQHVYHMSDGILVILNRLESSGFQPFFRHGTLKL